MVGIDEPVSGYDRWGRRTQEGPPIPANLQQILDALSKPPPQRLARPLG